MKKIIFLFLLLLFLSGCMYVPPNERDIVFEYKSYDDSYACLDNKFVEKNYFEV